MPLLRSSKAGTVTFGEHIHGNPILLGQQLLTKMQHDLHVRDFSPGYLLAGFTTIYLTYSAISALIHYFSGQSRYSRAQVYVGCNAKWFPRFRASLASFTRGHEMLYEGYERFSKDNKLFTFPLFAQRPFVCLPPASIHELLQQPDSAVSFRPIGTETVAVYWTGDEDIAGPSHTIHLNACHKKP